VPGSESSILAQQSTPLLRLQFFLMPGLFALAAVLLWAMQPAGGPTLDLPAWRPFDIHPAVWVCLVTGFGAYVVSVWIWALKPDNPATQLFALSGVMTLMFTFAATRSFIVAPGPDWLDGALRVTNIFGASGFGIVMTCLFLIYPVPLPLSRWIASATVAGFGLWTLAGTFGPFRHSVSVQTVTFIEMIAIILAGMGQLWAARHDPRQRAIALWLGVCVLVGAGTFIALVAVPSTFGHEPLVLSHYAFASFLLIYAGLAVGLVRYRLFELGSWAFQLIFHVCVALAILATDTVLIGSLSLAPGAALGIALFGMAFLYMPLRDYAWRKLTRVRAPDHAAVFRAVVAVALKPSGGERAQSWKALFQDLYAPLDIEQGASPIAVPAIGEEGVALHLPQVADSSALVLRYPHRGRGLFTQRDLSLAEQIVILMLHTEESRGAYDRGVSAERTRIAQDIHDNIGAQLLRALHSGQAERKDAMIRDTLADLRDVINNAQSPELPVAMILADLRAETADRLSPHGVSLVWQVEAGEDTVLSAPLVHALRSLIREAASNAIKYAGARRMTVSVTVDDGDLRLRVEDDGRGFAVDAVRLGHGLANMKARAESLGGDFVLASEGKGTCLSVRIPFDFRGASA